MPRGADFFLFGGREVGVQDDIEVVLHTSLTREIKSECLFSIEAAFQAVYASSLSLILEIDVFWPT